MRDLTEAERREIDAKLGEVTAAIHALAARVDAVATRLDRCPHSPVPPDRSRARPVV